MLLDNKKALVIGGSGALGPSLISQLRALGCKVTSTTRAVGHVSGGIVTLDILNRDEILEILHAEGYDYIFNLAADLGTSLDLSLNVNVLGLNNLLSACVELCYPAKIVLIGSAAEYGNVAVGANPVSESQPLSPVSVYGLTKVWQTQLALHYGDRLDIVIARMFNLDAPNLKQTLFLGNLDQQILQLKEGSRREITTGPLDAVRDYVDVAEAARQICAIGVFGESSQAYHVASGLPQKMRAILLKRLKAASLHSSVHKVSKNLGSARSPLVSTIYADVSKTRLLLAQLESVST